MQNARELIVFLKGSASSAVPNPTRVRGLGLRRFRDSSIGGCLLLTRRVGILGGFQVPVASRMLRH